MPDQTYSLTIRAADSAARSADWSGDVFISGTAPLLLIDPSVVAYKSLIIPISDTSTTYADPEYNDSSWAQMLAPFGNSNSSINYNNLPKVVVTPAAVNTSTWSRIKFSMENPAPLRVSALYDDLLTLWVNGSQAFQVSYNQTFPNYATEQFIAQNLIGNETLIAIRSSDLLGVASFLSYRIDEVPDSPGFVSAGGSTIIMHRGRYVEHVSTGVFSSARASKKSEGDVYFEVKIANGELSPFDFVGLCREDQNLNSYIGSDYNGWGYYQQTGSFRTGGVDQPVSGSTWGSGDTVGVRHNRNSGDVYFYLNGVMQTGGPVFNVQEDLFPAVSMYREGHEMHGRFCANEIQFLPPGCQAWEKPA